LKTNFFLGTYESFISLKSQSGKKYRIVYAVASIDSIVLYDTQQIYPLAYLTNFHYSAITDLTWFVYLFKFLPIFFFKNKTKQNQYQSIKVIKWFKFMDFFKGWILFSYRIWWRRTWNPNTSSKDFFFFFCLLSQFLFLFFFLLGVIKYSQCNYWSYGDWWS